MRVDLVTGSLGAGLKNEVSVVRCIDPGTPVSAPREHEDFYRTRPLGFLCRPRARGAQREVHQESCSDSLIPLFAEKLMFKNAPTPQEFKEGDDAVIVCDVVSSLPPTIIWKHKGRDVILKKDGKAREVSWWCPFRDQMSISHQGSDKAHVGGSGEQNGGGHKGGEKQFVPNSRS